MTSGLTWQQLRDLKLSELTDAADGWSAVSKHADAARERVDGDMSGKLSKTQESESAKSAVKRLERLSENYHYIYTECGLIRGTVDGLATELASPQKRLREALDDAAAKSYTVNEDGSMDYPAGGENAVTGEEVPGEEVPGGRVMGNNGLLASGNSGLYQDGNGKYSPGMGPDSPLLKSPNPHHARAQEIADRIARALREAREIDDRYSSALHKLKAAPGLKVDTKTWADVATDVDAVSGAAERYLAKQIPLDGSPADRKDWWDHLSKEQREEYLTSFPDVIGNLDGIPVATRDEANRENLKFLIAKLEGHEGSEDILKGMKGIQAKLQETTDPPMYLLGIGDQGNGRAIVSYGNPDTSKNVSAYVPGLGTKLNEGFAGGTLNRAMYTKMDADQYDSSTASIVWLGYDAPQNVDVMSETDAEHGAPDYNSFMEGIGATNDSKDLHLTAIGHSYGSRMVGEAATQPSGIPGADDIILLGSPGTGASKASELNVGADHVFVGSAQNDPVTWLPSKAGLAAGPVGSSLLTPEHDRTWFGVDPASEAFGGIRFKVSDGPLPLWLSGEGATPAHSNYFDPNVDPESADNIARIVTGKSDSIKTEAPR